MNLKKRLIAVTLSALAFAPVVSSQQSPKLAAYELCTEIAENLDRLFCYDSAAGHVAARRSDVGVAELRIQEVLAQSKLSFSEVLTELENTPVEFGGWRYLLRFVDRARESEQLTTVIGAVFSAPGTTSSPLELFWQTDPVDDSDWIAFQPQFFAYLPAYRDEEQGLSAAALLVGCEDQIESAQILLPEEAFEQLWNRWHPASWVQAVIRLDEQTPIETQMRWTAVPAEGGLRYALRFGRGAQSADLIQRLTLAETIRFELTATSTAGQIRNQVLKAEMDLGASEQAAKAVAISIRNACEGAASS